MSALPAITAPPGPSGVARRAAWVAVALLGAALLAAMVRLAWLCDDAYITLRTVENLLAGHGPVWNPGERVQTYTHPAWFWLLAGARWLTGEHFFTTIVLSLAIAGAAAALLAARALRPLAIATVLVLLLASRAFGDFTTSGLETPLSMLLLAMLARVDERGGSALARAGAIGAVVAACGLTRLDLVLLGLPLLLGSLRGVPPLRLAAVLVAALSPLLAWSAFAAFYYGSPFPITAWAKAFGPGVPAGDLIAQGGRYLAHAAADDPATCVIIVAGLAAGFGVRNLGGRLLALGALLACAWVVRVGGDFMAGRFLVPPFVVAVALLARWLAAAPTGARAAAFAAAVVLVFVGGRPNWLVPPGADAPREPVHGIQDERRVYCGKLGLFGAEREIPVAGRFTTALRRQGRTAPIVLGSGMAGGIPFVAGELFHFVDPWLCDPLLMRLPVADPAHWRIGHFTRAVPEGYAESIAFGDVRIVHAGLARYYAPLHTVLRAPLWSRERLAALAAVLTGRDAALRDDYVASDYSHPARVDLRLADFPPSAAAEGTFWFDDPAVRCIGRGGLRLAVGEAVAARAMHVLAVPLAHYHFTFRAGARVVGKSEGFPVFDAGLPPPGDDGDVLAYLRALIGLRRFPVPLPPDLPPFDAIDVDVAHMPWILPALGAVELTR